MDGTIAPARGPAFDTRPRPRTRARSMYALYPFARPLLFTLDAETAHTLSLDALDRAHRARRHAPRSHLACPPRPRR